MNMHYDLAILDTKTLVDWLKEQNDTYNDLYDFAKELGVITDYGIKKGSTPTILTELGNYGRPSFGDMKAIQSYVVDSQGNTIADVDRDVIIEWLTNELTHFRVEHSSWFADVYGDYYKPHYHYRKDN